MQNSFIQQGDTAWLLISAALVLLMTIGLSFFYAGLAPARNAINTLKMSFICLAIVPLLWASIGFSLVFSAGNGLIGNLHWAGLQQINLMYSTNQPVPEYAYVAFQMLFAVIAPALVSGSFVGRMRFKPYVLFIILWSLLVYIPIAHWVWGTNGWLNKLHVLDFAGGLVVHINAGVSGLIAAAMLGPRMYLKRKAVTAAHNIPFVLLGCGLLWFGWFGFNAGSALAANQIAALAFITTLLAPAACMLVWVLLCWLTQRPSSASGAAFATVAGLVAITPACGYVTPLSAILIGTCTAVVCYFVLYYKRILRLNKIDDTLDVFTCHGVGGVVGSLLVGVLATQTVNATGENGLLYGNPQQLWIQFIATAAVILYCALATALILWLLKTFIQVRPDPITEHKGIDVTEHGESAYTQD